MSQATGGQAAPAHPTGTVRLTVQGNVMTVGLTPTVVVSGHPVRARFGTQDVPVWAGPNRVEAHAQWMRRYGQASLEFDVPPGGVVPVHYAVPWHQFTRGAMGHEKQTRPGAWVFGVLIGVPLLLVVLAVAAGLFAG
ncbi:hypothetical protein [Phycicoccus avicenniae]|uniref:hypothetical protein n=1 Tax=Phycicoccus avicenniae TaxID=2828860 RepID=UPI003D2C89AD